jgi:hypothetical protein
MHRNNTTYRSSIPNVVLDYPWTKTKEDTASYYKVDETKGLTEERVRQDLETYGPNGKKIMLKLYNKFLCFFFSYRTTNRRRQTTLETDLRTIR